MNKVVYNTSYGGFSLSLKAIEYLNDKYSLGLDSYGYTDCVLSRHDPRLIEVVETLRDAASGSHASLKIACIDCNSYRIREYGGNEYVETPTSIDWVIIESG